MSLALYRKYRPSGFDEVVGQEHVVKTLKNAVKNGKVAHAYLFSGPRGTGKTSIARILSKAVNCTDPKDGAPCGQCQNCKSINAGQFLDLVEIDAATHTQVDKMRDIIERINFSPSQGRMKVYIIDEVHMLSKGAFNALLKTLEEPPAHVLFILATTEIHKIPATIISRCQRFDFRHLSVGEIKARLAEIAKEEKVEVEDGVLEFVALSSGGGMRDSESLFGQIIALEDGGKITLKEVRDILSLPDATLAAEIINLLFDKRWGEAVKSVNRVAEDGYDLSELNKGIVEHLRRLLLIKLSPDMRQNFSASMTEEQLDELEQAAKEVQLPRLFRFVGAFVKSQGGIKGAVLPQLPLEMAIAEISIAEEGLTEVRPAVYDAQAGVKAPAAVPAAKKVEGREAPAQESVIEEQSGVEENTPVEAQAPIEEAPVEEVPAAMAAVSGEAVTLQRVKDEWADIVLDVRKHNNSLTACLKTCEPIALDGDQVIVACQYSFHKDKLQKVENRAAVEQVASEAVEAQVKLKFVGKEEAQQMGFEIEEVHLEAKQAEDLVNSALDMFGGEVVA